ncbi:sugar ABC transporter permease, partial [Salipiger sp. HF18]|nr:sugar ABC transporter permease [Salipiger sp. HF18]
LDFGYGSAIAVLFTMLLMVVVLFYLRRTGKAVE